MTAPGLWAPVSQRHVNLTLSAILVSGKTNNGNSGSEISEAANKLDIAFITSQTSLART